LLSGAEAELPLKVAKSLDGIISYLTGKNGENVHDKGIVTITSISLDSDGPKNFSCFSGLLGFPRNACPPDSLHNRVVISEIVGG
jgi:hypothetical protein